MRTQMQADLFVSERMFFSRDSGSVGFETKLRCGPFYDIK